jgi:riboflavin synthase
MFSGITQGLFPVTQVEKTLAGTLRYGVALSPTLAAGLEIGASVAVDGVCQTVVEIKAGIIYFQAIPETLSKTTLSAVSVGRQLSIERSIRWGDEIGGHLMTGHVFETGTVVKAAASPEWALLIQCSVQCTAYLFEKGWIGVDGSSLTVGRVNKPNSQVTVYLIPETRRRTQLGHKQPGEQVNLEVPFEAMCQVDTLKAYLKDWERRLSALEARFPPP